MRLRGDTIGASTSSRRAGRRWPRRPTIAQALADVATIGILQQRSITAPPSWPSSCSARWNTRIVIEQAKGVLAEYGGVDMDVAFDALRATPGATTSGSASWPTRSSAAGPARAD